MTIQELEAWYAGRELPGGPIWLHKSMKVNNPEFFVESHFTGLHATNIQKNQEPLILRLVMLKEWIESNNSTPVHS